MSAKECSSFAFRSSHGFRATKRKAVLDAYAPDTSEKPVIVVTYWTPGVLPMMSSTFLATASVRSREEASGRTMLAKK